MAQNTVYTPWEGTILVVQSLSHVWLFETPWTAARRLPCPSLSPGVYSNSCPLSRWYHPTISSFVAPFSFCPQSFPALGLFPMSMLNDYIIIIWYPLAGLFCFCIFSLLWLNIFFGWSFSIDKRQAEDVVGAGRTIRSCCFNTIVKLNVSLKYKASL